MVFDHEKLDVYKLSLDFAEWAYIIVKDLKGADRFAKEQLIRASQSITLNIAEGNGRRPSPDRARFFQIAYGSALECAAILDVLNRYKLLQNEQCQEGKVMLKRVVSMLIALINRMSYVNEDENEYLIT
jgi:four helix bundle protein